MSALSDLLNGQPVTARQAADLAVDKGIDLPYGTLSGYWAGKHGRPTAASLKKSLRERLAEMGAAIHHLARRNREHRAKRTKSRRLRYLMSRRPRR